MSRRKKKETALLREPARRVLKALTTTQEDLIRLLDQGSDQIVVIGPAGTGKTYVPAARAIEWLDQGKIDKIVITRPNVPAGPRLGFLPGTVEEKYRPWVENYIDAFNDFAGKEKVDLWLKHGRIELVPLEIARGRTFKDCVLFIDEAQNTTVHEMFMMLTRLGDDCIVVISGDVSQDDLKGARNGLSHLVTMIDDLYLPVPVVEFMIDDIVRSKRCKEWVEAYGDYEDQYDVYE